MKEKDVEDYLVKKVRELGGIAYKFISPGHAGVPDRLVCLPGGHILFVELKASGEMPRPLQINEQRKLRDLGMVVWGRVDSREAVDGLITYARGLLE